MCPLTYIVSPASHRRRYRAASWGLNGSPATAAHRRAGSTRPRWLLMGGARRDRAPARAPGDQVGSGSHNFGERDFDRDGLAVRDFVWTRLCVNETSADERRRLMTGLESDDRPDQTVVPRDALGRRQFLRGVAATGALAGSGSLLASCSSGPSGSAVSPSPTTTGARQGGNLKVGLTGGSGSDTLDPHKGL